MTPAERYQQHGLRDPIIIRPNGDNLWISAVMVLIWVGLFFLIKHNHGYSYTQMLVPGSVAGFLVRLFFGYLFVYFLVDNFENYMRGAVAFSEHGLYLNEIGNYVPWKDVGPARLIIDGYQTLAGSTPLPSPFSARRILKFHLHVVIRNRANYQRRMYPPLDWFRTPHDEHEQVLSVVSVKPDYLRQIDPTIIVAIINTHARLDVSPGELPEDFGAILVEML